MCLKRHVPHRGAFPVGAFAFFSLQKTFNTLAQLGAQAGPLGGLLLFFFEKIALFLLSFVAVAPSVHCPGCPFRHLHVAHEAENDADKTGHVQLTCVGGVDNVPVTQPRAGA